MRVLVIGGTGFIGRVLVPRLVTAGHEVGVVQRPNAADADIDGTRSIPADRRHLRDYASALHRFAADVVIDLILSSGRQAEELADVFAGRINRLVAATSADVYRAAGVLHGFEKGALEPMPLTEESALRSAMETYPAAQIAALKQVFGWLDDDYDKVAVERALRADGRVPTTILRLPMIYGPGDRLHRLYPIIKRIDDGRQAILLAESVAQWRGPRGFVENVAAAIALAATNDHASNRTYNVAEQPAYTELDWTRLVGEAMQWRGDIEVVPNDSAPAHLRMPGRLEQHWVVDSSRIRAEVGYIEPVSLPEALRRTIAWERANPPASNPAMFDYVAEDAALGARR